MRCWIVERRWRLVFSPAVVLVTKVVGGNLLYKSFALQIIMKCSSVGLGVAISIW